MGVKRPVDTSFWTDGKVDEFSPEDKFFMLYLLTNPFSRQLGIYEISVKQAAFQMGYSVDSFNALLERFEHQYKMIKFSKETSEVAIINFLRHSVMKGGKPVEDCIKQDISKVKNRSLLDFVFRRLHNRDDLNATVKKIVDEYIKENDIHNDNDNDRTGNDSYNESYPDTGNESSKDSLEEPKKHPKRKSKAEKEAEALTLTVCELLGKHDYSLFTEGVPELQKAIVSFVEFRKGIKKPMTDLAIDLLIKKLNGMTKDIREQIEIINQSIMNGWQGVFPLKDNNANNGKRYTRTETKPNWMAPSMQLGAAELAAINRALEEDPDVQSEAEQMRKRMQEKYGKAVQMFDKNTNGVMEDGK